MEAYEEMIRRASMSLLG